VSLQNDLATQRFYQDLIDDEEDDDDDELDERHRDEHDEEIQRMYKEQFEISRTQNENTNSIPPPITTSSTAKSRVIRSPRDTTLFYEWFKDGEKVISSNADDNQIVTLDGFTLLQNGTLKFQASNITTGEFRCKVKYIDKKFVIGPIVSQATVVEIASKYQMAQTFISNLKIFRENLR
jgi:hypothetical protein